MDNRLLLESQILVDKIILRECLSKDCKFNTAVVLASCVRLIGINRLRLAFTLSLYT